MLLTIILLVMSLILLSTIIIRERSTASERIRIQEKRISSLLKSTESLIEEHELKTKICVLQYDFITKKCNELKQERKINDKEFEAIMFKLKEINENHS